MLVYRAIAAVGQYEPGKLTVHAPLAAGLMLEQLRNEAKALKQIALRVRKLDQADQFVVLAEEWCTQMSRLILAARLPLEAKRSRQGQSSCLIDGAWNENNGLSTAIYK
ncbi:hypothetical protein WJX73_001385 [Symbiochloris irregularis]|uniref:Uncharacterized protein n=1 Tax=Symbiochloris irregularis TaxID=706552 RepID=A0AAW1P347_9CHLO